MNVSKINIIKNITKKSLVSAGDATSILESFLSSIKNKSKSRLVKLSGFGSFSFKHDLLKNTFIFDYYKNNNTNEIKIGYRFVFQSHSKTITDIEVKEVISDIIISSLAIDSVSIPGLKIWLQKL